MWESNGYMRVKSQAGGCPGIRTGSRVGPPFPSSPFSPSVAPVGACALVWGHLSDLVFPPSPPGGFLGVPECGMGSMGRGLRGRPAASLRAPPGAQMHASAKHGAPHLAAPGLFPSLQWGRAWSKVAGRPLGRADLVGKRPSHRQGNSMCAGLKVGHLNRWELKGTLRLSQRTNVEAGGLERDHSWGCGGAPGSGLNSGGWVDSIIQVR